MTRRGTLWFGWTLALLAMAGFASLGAWQYGRMQDKQALLAHASRALDDRTPRALDSVVEGMAWVEGEGRIDLCTLLFDNQLRNGRPGIRMYCVATVGNGAHRLVDFGWLPLGGDRTLPPAACPAGPMQLRGLLAPAPSSGLRMGAAMQEVDGRWLMLRVDPAAIAAAMGIDALPAQVLRLDPRLPVGHARDLDLLPNTLPPERHLGYAVQWWALALAVLATALVLSIRSHRRSKSQCP